MGKIVLLVGIPGSGKSYYVTKYMETHPQESCVVCSADHHFEELAKKKKAELEAAGDLEGAAGVPNYLFDYMQLRTAHMSCQQKCIAAMDNDVDTIFIDNTNITAKERQFYVSAATDHGYGVEFKVFPNDQAAIQLAASRNQHGVPADKVAARAAAQDMAPGYYKRTLDGQGNWANTKMLESVQFLRPAQSENKPSLDSVSSDIARVKERIQSIKLEFPEDKSPEIAEALDDMTGALDVAQHHVEDIKGKLSEEM
jgi:predicted kinase